MLIILDLQESEIDKFNYDNYKTVLEELLRADRCGYHLLVIPSKLKKFLLKIDGLSTQNTAHIANIIERYPQTGRLYEKASIYVKLKDITEAKIINKEIQLPLLCINPFNIGKESVLLVEDAYSDGVLYKFILDNMAKRIRIKLNFKSGHGGGSSIAKEFKTLHDGKNFGLCLIDSDKKYPNDPSKSDKQQTIEKIISNESWPLMKLNVLPCRELENIIPYDLIHDLDCSKTCDWHPYINQILSQEKSDGIPYNESFWLFFDIKNGVKSDNIDNQWLKAKIHKANIASEDYPMNCYGNKFIKCFEDKNKAMSEFEDHILRNPDWRSVFEPIFSYICWFFIGGNKRIT